MTSELKDFAERDTGFAQYCEQYQRVSTDPGTLDSYMRWIEDQMREQGMRAAAQHEGMEQGIKQGRDEQSVVIAHKLLEVGDSIEKVASVTGLSVHKLNEIKRQILTTSE